MSGQRTRIPGLVIVVIACALVPCLAMAQTQTQTQTPVAAASRNNLPGTTAPPLERKAGKLPGYPAEAKQKGIGGVVTVNLTIDAAGKVGEVHAVRSVPSLEAAAVTAVRGWQYAPPTVSPAEATVVFLFDAATAKVDEAHRIPPQGPQQKRTKSVSPQYPAGPAKHGAPPGQATFDIVVNSAGKVIDMKPLRVTSGFEGSARNAIKQWEYEPLMVNGVAVPFVMTVTVVISPR